MAKGPLSLFYHKFCDVLTPMKRCFYMFWECKYLYVKSFSNYRVNFGLLFFLFLLFKTHADGHNWSNLFYQLKKGFFDQGIFSTMCPEFSTYRPQFVRNFRMGNTIVFHIGSIMVSDGHMILLMYICKYLRGAYTPFQKKVITLVTIGSQVRISLTSYIT